MLNELDQIKKRETLFVPADQAEAQPGADLPSFPANPLNPPPQLGEQYEILEFVGAGGMGTVWKVHDKELNQNFAIKVLKPEFLADESTLKRFHKEAKLATELTHANIAAIFGPGEDKNGQPYLIMRFAEGESLANILKREGKLTPERAEDIFRQVADALTHSHMKGVVHRDIKPSNIIIGQTDSGADIVQLVDFGIARSIHEEVTKTQALTSANDVFGSPRYMSPEQFLGKEVGPGSDFYSLGCVFFEMLTGTPPFTEENPVKLVLQHLNEEPNYSKVPKKYRHLVSGLLQKEADLRVSFYRNLDKYKNLKGTATLEERHRQLIIIATCWQFASYMLVAFSLQMLTHSHYFTPPSWLAICLLVVFAIEGTYPLASLLFKSASSKPAGSRFLYIHSLASISLIAWLSAAALLGRTLIYDWLQLVLLAFCGFMAFLALNDRCYEWYSSKLASLVPSAYLNSLGFLPRAIISSILVIGILCLSLFGLTCAEQNRLPKNIQSANLLGPDRLNASAYLQDLANSPLDDRHIEERLGFVLHNEWNSYSVATYRKICRQILESPYKLETSLKAKVYFKLADTYEFTNPEASDGWKSSIDAGLALMKESGEQYFEPYITSNNSSHYAEILLEAADLCAERRDAARALKALEMIHEKSLLRLSLEQEWHWMDLYRRVGKLASPPPREP